MNQTVTGVIHGKLIELDCPLAMADGQPVEITVRPLRTSQPWGEGILKSVGGWAAYPEMDDVMERVHRERGTAI